jgi:hypothetical protein
MRNVFKLGLLSILLTVSQPSRGMEFLLSRTGEGDEEYARCFSQKATIKYKEDIVYSEDKYDNLRDNIYERLECLRRVDKEYNESQPPFHISGQKKFYPNFMTVILAATGKNKNKKFERVFCNLHGENKNGKYDFYSESDTKKFVIFYSNENSGIEQEYENKLLIRLNDLKKEEGKNKKIIKRVTDSDTPSHTEPLSISAILSLNPTTFSEMLSTKYNLKYYEIHFISSLDACVKCPKVVYNSIGKIKEHFKNNNLFVFYHADKHYETLDKITIPYSLKFNVDKKWNYIPGRISTYQYIDIKKDNFPGKERQKYNLRGSNQEPYLCDSIPNFYFSFIYDLESDNPQIEEAARRIITRNDL